MRKSKKSHANTVKFSNNAVTSSFDIWLQRLSHISQSLLGLFTITGFFFIVIPIYQKELLSESIAKSELKLIAIQAKIDKLEKVERLRNVQMLLYSLLTTCSKFTQDLLTHKPEGMFDNEKLIERDEREILEFNAEECWSNTYDKLKKDLRLTKAELKKLDKDIQLVVDEIKTKRPILISEYDNCRLTENELASIESAPYDRLEELAVLAGLSEEAIIEQRKKSALFEKKYKISRSFQLFLNSQKDSLSEKWRVSAPSEL